MGIIPVWGFQLATAIFFAVVFKLNKALVIIAANISIPPMIPVIIFLSIKAGAYWMGGDVFQINLSNKITIQSVSNNLKQYVYGSISLAVIAAVLFGSISFVLLKVLKRKTVTGKPGIH